MISLSPDQNQAVRPTRVEVDLSALEANFRASKNFIGESLGYMAVVKADAYGHGAIECSKRLETAGIDWLGVAIPEEGLQIRNAGVKTRILCLGSFWPGQERMLIDKALTPVIFSLETAKALNDAARDTTIDVHVKVDTGMGRVGTRFETVGEFAADLKTLRDIRVAGLMTHLASAEDHKQDDFTSLQIERFAAACDAFRDAGHDPHWIHIANSPGAIGHPRSRGNLVRLGGALYGLLDDILEDDASRPDLHPVLALRSEIADIKDLPAGETLGYGRTFETTHNSRIALVPVGYADGLPRVLSNKGHACIRGNRVPIVGRISMDWTMLDVTGAETATIGDVVTFIGRDAKCEITAAEIARAADTIGYEITCGIGPRVRRTYI